MRPSGSWWAARLAASLAPIAALLAACDGDSPARPAAADVPAAPRPAKAEIVMAPEGEPDVRGWVRSEAERAAREGRDVVVYVGAPWCEPCTRFHKAVEAGELDAAFPGLRLLEFDHDRDQERLGRAGYSSRMIPLFAIPAAGGEASPLRVEGSVKGEGAVANIAPRLRAMLAEARASR